MTHVIVLTGGDRDRIVAEANTQRIQTWGGRGDAISITDPSQVSEQKTGHVIVKAGSDVVSIPDAEIVEIVEQ